MDPMSRGWVEAGLKHLALALALWCGCISNGLGCRPHPGAMPPWQLSAASSEVPRQGRFELTLGPLRSGIEARVQLQSPSGKRVMQRTFARHGQWMARYSPSELGQYTYVAEVNSGSGFHEIGHGVFAAVEGGEKGPVGLSAKEKHQLVFSDGTPFVPLGENRINIYDPSWNDRQRGITDYIRFMAENGMNTLRVFIITDIESEEHPEARPPLGVLEPELGKFDERTADAFDEIFDAAEKQGIYVILVPFALGFSPNDAWKSWDDNPYSAKRGGPAKDRLDFFRLPQARALAERKLAYLADRYGYSSHLLAIDVLNEPEWDGEIPENIWIPWAEQMAQVWHQLDSGRHLVTAGPVGFRYNYGGDERPWYQSPRDDVVQWHLYGKEIYEVHALADEMTRLTRQTWEFNKPVLVGEFAYGGEPKPLYDHTHVGIWSAVFSGAGVLAHSAPPFNLDSDEPMTPERAHHFAVLSRFLKNLAAVQPLVPLEGAARPNPRTTRVWTLGRDRARAFWLLGPQVGYGRPVRNVELRLQVPLGNYRVAWFDDVTGTSLGEKQVTVSGPLVLQAPTFVRHLAGTLKPEEN